MLLPSTRRESQSWCFASPKSHARSLQKRLLNGGLKAILETVTGISRELCQLLRTLSSEVRHSRFPKRCADSLVDFASSGVAFHHAGLDLPDRQGVEKAYLKGDLSVICSTSTLAVGVNLPCHLVIIKNTVGYTGAGVKEYPDLEIMQMLGRAGRPQFDDSAVAVIMARNEKAKKYEQMVSGQEVLESTLHLNLIEHLVSWVLTCPGRYLTPSRMQRLVWRPSTTSIRPVDGCLGHFLPSDSRRILANITFRISFIPQTWTRSWTKSATGASASSRITTSSKGTKRWKSPSTVISWQDTAFALKQ